MKGTKGFNRYFEVVALLHQRGQTDTEEIAAAMGKPRDKTLAMLGELRSVRIVKRTKPPGSHTPYCWSLGAEEDIRTRFGRAVRPRILAIQFAAMMRALARPAQVCQVAQAMGVTHSVAARHIARGRCWHLFPVAGHDDTHQRTAFYRFAPGEPDVKRIRKPEQQRCAEYRERQRIERLRIERLRARSANSSIFRLAQQAA